MFIIEFLENLKKEKNSGEEREEDGQQVSLRSDEWKLV